MSVYAEILEWSRRLPAWQRDALRRLTVGTVDDDQIPELEHLCLKAQGSPIERYESVDFQPIEETHLPPTGKAGNNVSLTSIGEVCGVNLISSDLPLEFGATGLTIIFGYNGSGKSGYARILKQVCRARDGRSKILPNVFEGNGPSAPSAKICFVSGDVASEHEWAQGRPAPPELGNISIFDAGCAEFYVTEENDVAYRPFGLDLFDRLAALAAALRLRLQTSRSSLDPTCPVPLQSLLEANEFIGVYPVTAGTDPNSIESVHALNPEEEKQLDLLKRSVEEENPAKKVAEIRARKGRLDVIAEEVDKITSILSQPKIQEFKAHVEALKTAQEEARLVSDEAFRDMLPQTGGPAWKGLWDHARGFAAVAYSGETFPNTGDSALCLLCQQPLDGEAKARFLSFETFVKQEAEAKLANAQGQVDEDIAATGAINIAPPADVELNDLRSHQEKWADDYAVFKSEAAIGIVALRKAFNSGAWEIAIPTFDVQPIRDAAQDLEAEAIAIDATEDSEELASRAARILSLEARKWIATNKTNLMQDIERAKQKKAIDAAIQTTDTTAISRKSTELTKRHVTRDLAESFETELAGINASHLHLCLTSHSTRGTTRHRIELRDRQDDRISVKDIVSEGEFRAIAVAAFFAELGQSDTQSAIVVDDPVSSLDHLHCARVAGRLISEAKQRQVIVFTHEVLFMHHLIDEAEKQNVSSDLRQVTRGDTQVGIVSPDIPWDTQKVSHRIGILKQQLTELNTVRANNRADYELAGGNWYGRLRETWESVIEEVLFNRCIQRLRLSVETRRLEKVTVIEEDYKTIYAGMTKASRWLQGHSTAVGDTTPFPKPGELQGDLNVLTEFVAYLKKRQG